MLVDSIRQHNEWWQNQPNGSWALKWQHKNSYSLIISNTVRESVLGMKYMLLFSLKLLFQAFLFHYLLNYLTDACINTCRALCMKCSLPLSSFIEKWVVTANFSRMFQYKIYENLFNGSWVIRCWEGWTDIHGKASFLLETCQRCPVNIVKILFGCSKKLRNFMLRSCYIALWIRVFQVARHTHMAAVDLQD